MDASFYITVWWVHGFVYGILGYGFGDRDDDIARIHLLYRLHDVLGLQIMVIATNNVFGMGSVSIKELLDLRLVFYGTRLVSYGIGFEEWSLTRMYNKE